MKNSSNPFVGFVALLALASATGCENPADGKPRAQVGAPTTATPGPSVSEPLAISAESSKVEFVGSKVTGSHDGGFTVFAGRIQLVDGKAEGGTIEVTIDTRSVFTDTPRLTRHLQSDAFFDVTKFPEAKFVSTRIVAGGGAGATHSVEGNLNLHGVERSIQFPVKVRITRASVNATSEFALNRKDFGINYKGAPDDLIRDEVVVKLDIVASRPKS